MSRGVFLAVVVVACALVVAIGGCPDPCVLGGIGCNVNDDCPSGRLCRLRRDGETGCTVVRGVCSDVACGSVDDCAAGECCDPGTNTCVDASLYTGPLCDEFTCGDCAATQLKTACTEDGDCAVDEVCRTARGGRGRCFPICDDDVDCALDERCVAGEQCSYRIGTPCDLDVDFSGVDVEDSCAGLDCIDLDADGTRTEPYCTGFCSDFEPGPGDLCPPGFVCDADSLRCRRL